MSRPTAQTRELLLDWLAMSEPGLSTSNVSCSPSLELSPLDRPTRRRISRDAVWFVLERGGDFFSLVGMAPDPKAGADCYGVYVLGGSGDLEYSLWRRHGGRWELVDSRREQLF